jgi:hypothetical protein
MTTITHTTNMALRSPRFVVNVEYPDDAVITVLSAAATFGFAVVYIATQLNLEDGLSATYMSFVLAAAMWIFSQEDNPMRVRRTAIAIVVVAGVSVAIFFGVLGCVVVGRIHWIELIILGPAFVLAAVLLRVACRQLRNQVAELEEKYYTLSEHNHKTACRVCGFEDEPKARRELWEPFYDARYGVYRPGIAYSYALKKYECGFARSGRCAEGPFEQPRDLAEHMLNEHWNDRFHCPGCLRSLRRVRRGGGGWGE